MDASTTLSIATAVVMLTQIVKGWGLKDGWGLPVAALFSIGGVALWSVSHTGFSPALVWSQFTCFVQVFTMASGVFGIANREPPAKADDKKDADKGKPDAGSDVGEIAPRLPLVIAAALVAVLLLWR